MLSTRFLVFLVSFSRTLAMHIGSLLPSSLDTNLRYRGSRETESKLAKGPPLSDIAWTTARSAEISNSPTPFLFQWILIKITLILSNTIRYTCFYIISIVTKNFSIFYSSVANLAILIVSLLRIVVSLKFTTRPLSWIYKYIRKIVLIIIKIPWSTSNQSTIIYNHKMFIKFNVYSKLQIPLLRYTILNENCTDCGDDAHDYKINLPIS